MTIFPTETARATNTPSPTLTPDWTPTPTVAPELTPTLPPLAATGKLAFTTSDRRLWTINPDGTDRAFVSQDVDTEYMPLWSPDGEKLAYREKRIISNIPIFVWRVAEPTAIETYILTARVDTRSEAAWSPDSRNMLFSEDFEGIYMYSLDNKRTKKAIETMRGTIDKNGILSPNGNKLVFVHYELSTNFFVGLLRDFDESMVPYTYDETFTQYFHPEIMLMDEGVSTLRDQPFRFLWAPDSQTFVYATEEVDEKGGNLYIGGDIVRRLASGLNYPARYNMDMSSKGDKVVFTDADGLRVMNINSSASTLLLEKPGLLSPGWSPDGKHIAFVDSGQIYVITADGSSLYSVPGAEGAVMLDWSPAP